MTFTTKKAIAIVLAILMVFSTMMVGTITANAATTVYFVNSDNNWSTQNIYAYTYGSETLGTWPGTKMDLIDETNNVYSVDAKSTTSNIIFNNGGFGIQTGDNNQVREGKYFEVTTSQWYDTLELALAAAGSYVKAEYYVAGESALCGSNWQAADTANGMTKQADGSYTKVYENVAAGTYKYKITNGTWDTTYTNGTANDNDNNSAVTVDTSGSTVTIKLSGSSVTATVTPPAATSESATSEAATSEAATSETATSEAATSEAETSEAASSETPSDPEGELTSFYVTGSEGLTGVNWSTEPNEAARMTKKADGSYEKVFENVPAGEYAFKVIEINDGAVTWHPDGMGNDSSVTVDVDGSTVVVTLVPTGNASNDKAEADVIPPASSETSTSEAETSEAAASESSSSEVGGYYLIGSISNWEVKADYKLEFNSEAFGGANEYVIKNVPLTTDSQFKIIYSPNGATIDSIDGAVWYPDGIGNNYGENGEITADDTYNIYFRPYMDGDGLWFYNCIFVIPTSEVVTSEDATSETATSEAATSEAETSEAASEAGSSESSAPTRPVISNVVDKNAVTTNRYYFLMPDSWKNIMNDNYDGQSTDSCCPGIYWWSGSYDCETTSAGWPGYIILDNLSSEGYSNIFYCDVPTDVEYIIFNNTVNGSDYPQYSAQTVNVDTSEGGDGMIYVVDPDKTAINDYTGNITEVGNWFYYYGNGTYGETPQDSSEAGSSESSEAGTSESSEAGSSESSEAGSSETGSDKIIGDANGNGRIDAQDVLFIRRYNASLSVPATFDADAADVNRNGMVDAQDVLFMRRHNASLSVPPTIKIGQKIS